MSRQPKKKANMPANLWDFIIKVDMFNDCEIAIFHDRKKYVLWFSERKMKKGLAASYNAEAVMAEDPDGKPWFLMYIPEDVKPDCLAHECLHIAWYVLDWHGIKVKYNNHEMLTYLMAHIMKQFYKQVDETHRLV